jgi:hypothetical protein
MKVLHTSPSKIETINPKQGPFGGALFFSSTEYWMGDVKYIYSVELDDSQIIEVSDLDCDETVNEIKELVSNCLEIEIDEYQAFELLTASETVWDMFCGEDSEWLADLDWTIQGLQAKAAKAAGFLAVESMDEQGTVYIINMVGQESLLTLEEVR